MSQDLKHFKPLDPGRINAMDSLELQYWCGELHCTPTELQDALGSVGNHVAAVRSRLESLYPDRPYRPAE